MLTGGPAWGVIGAAVVLVAALAFTGRALLECRQDAGNLDGQLSSAQDKAAENHEAVVDLRARYTACLDERRLDEEAQRGASRDYARKIEHLAGALERERAERDALARDDESCQAWRAAVACQPIADRLRDAASRAAEGGDD